jgi:hypothetical protein
MQHLHDQGNHHWTAAGTCEVLTMMFVHVMDKLKLHKDKGVLGTWVSLLNLTHLARLSKANLDRGESIFIYRVYMSTAGKSLYQIKELNICLFLFYPNQIKK